MAETTVSSDTTPTRPDRLEMRAILAGALDTIRRLGAEADARVRAGEPGAAADRLGAAILELERTRAHLLRQARPIRPSRSGLP